MSYKHFTSAVALSLAASSASAAFYTENFDDGTTDLTNGQIKNVANENYAPAWSGKYFRNKSGGNPAKKSEVTVTGVDSTQSSINVSFSLGLLDSFDKASSTSWGPDYIDFSANGNVLATMSKTGSGVYSMTTLVAENALLDSNDPNDWTDTLFDISLDFANSATSLVFAIQAYGAGWQGGSDESWGIDNLAFAYNTQTGGTGTGISPVPLPAAAWLFATAWLDSLASVGSRKPNNLGCRAKARDDAGFFLLKKNHRPHSRWFC